jgi:hypothetical protein
VAGAVRTGNHHVFYALLSAGADVPVGMPDALMCLTDGIITVDVHRAFQKQDIHNNVLDYQAYDRRLWNTTQLVLKWKQHMKDHWRGDGTHAEGDAAPGQVRKLIKEWDFGDYLSPQMERAVQSIFGHWSLNLFVRK